MENVAFLTRKKLTMDKFSSQVKISTINPIKNILNVVASSVVSSCDQLNGYISLSGKIKANIIFVNKLDAVEHAEIFFDFIEKQQQSVQLEDIFAEDKLTLKSVSFSGTEAICVFEHSVCLNGNYRYEIPSFNNEDENYVIKKSSFESLRFVTSCEDNFVVAEENEANFSDVTVLSSDASVIINEVNSLVDKISVEGKVIANVVYSDLDTVGLYTREFEFKQEISANGVLPNMTVQADVLVKNVTVTPEENDNKTNFVYAIDLFVKGMAYEDYTYEMVEDMFSLKNKIQTTIDYIEAKTFSKMKNFTDTIMLSEDISGIDNFDDILGVYLPEFHLDNIEEGEDKVYLVGSISSHTIYKAENDILTFETNLPVKFEVSKDKDDTAGKVVLSPMISSYKVKAGKYLEIIYSVNYSINFEKSVSEKFVKSFEVQTEKDKNEGGIKIYITRQGETLFEIAKSLNVRPETITSQNEVVDVFEQGEKIYIYSPINLCN